MKKSVNVIDVESLLSTVCLNGLDILNMVSKKKIDCAFIQCFMVIQMAIHMQIIDMTFVLIVQKNYYCFCEVVSKGEEHAIALYSNRKYR